MEQPLDEWIFSLDGGFLREKKIILDETEQETSQALDGCLFSLDDAFLNEKKHNLGDFQSL